jgi:3-hydroxymyristoyl/3-hydroxydecanoyl-(acyl carrier protein) dehydratase
VLPGIAQLHAILESIKKIEGVNLTIESVRRIRFKQIIRPGDSPRVIVKRNSRDKRSYSFRITLEDKVACSGSMVVKQIDPAVSRAEKA